MTTLWPITFQRKADVSYDIVPYGNDFHPGASGSSARQRTHSPIHAVKPIHAFQPPLYPPAATGQLRSIAPFLTP